MSEKMAWTVNPSGSQKNQHEPRPPETLCTSNSTLELVPMASTKGKAWMDEWNGTELNNSTLEQPLAPPSLHTSPLPGTNGLLSLALFPHNGSFPFWVFAHWDRDVVVVAGGREPLKSEERKERVQGSQIQKNYDGVAPVSGLLPVLHPVFFPAS